MKYYIMELQTDGDTASQVTTTADTLNSALSKYHEILMYAAISSLDVHACTVLDQYGNLVAKDAFTHNENPEPQEEL